MKKTILILSLLLACTFSSYAQSDATWEETIGFIKKYIHYLKVVNIGENAMWSRGQMKRLISKEKLGFYENYVETQNGTRYEYDIEVSIKLTKLLEVVSYSGENGIYLTTVGKDCKNYSSRSIDYKYYDSDGDSYSYGDEDGINSISIEVEDQEMLPRLFKAFQHLAKLATKKREAERKASGDKF